MALDTTPVLLNMKKASIGLITAPFRSSGLNSSAWVLVVLEIPGAWVVISNGKKDRCVEETQSLGSENHSLGSKDPELGFKDPEFGFKIPQD